MNNTWKQLEQSLRNNHPSLNLQTNPVLVAELCPTHTAEVLKQYCFLPAYIVNFLAKGFGRLKREGWRNTAKELMRNIQEETGSRTEGQVHYDILVRAIENELGLRVAGAVPCAATLNFLEQVRIALHNRESAFAAGVLYALEDSAVPELTIVATTINRSTLGEPVIDLKSMTAPEASRRIKSKVVREYSLQDFFTLHILDFEKGHQSRLKAAIQADLAKVKLPEPQMEQIQLGFEHTLYLMDAWWTSLSKIPLPVGP